MTDIHRFSDFAEERKRPEGPKVRIADLVGRQILITGFLVEPSKFKNPDGSKKDRLTLEFVLDGKKHIVFTGAVVLIDLTQKYQGEIPFYATIDYNGRYYSFS
jgi:hypothetical protein